MTVIAMPRAQRPRKLRIFRNDVDGMWYAECPCGWWHCHYTWPKLTAYVSNHWTYSFRHLDRFNLGGEA